MWKTLDAICKSRKFEIPIKKEHFQSYMDSMEQEVFIKVVLDKRRMKRNGKFPLKLRVYTSKPRVQKLYPIEMEFTEQEFEQIQFAKPGEFWNAQRLNLQLTEWTAKKIASEIVPFDFEIFEKRFFYKTHQTPDVIAYFHKEIKLLEEAKKTEKASVYRHALAEITQFIHHQTGTETQRIPFSMITENWLMQFEQYCMQVKGFSAAKIGGYLRPLRDVFNMALEQKDIDNQQYPFGKRKYRIPNSEKSTRWATQSEYLKILATRPENEDQIRTKDFLIFSILCNDLTPSDIAHLKFSNVNGDLLLVAQYDEDGNKLPFSKSTVCVITEELKTIIEKHGRKQWELDQYIFPLLSIGFDKNREKFVIDQFSKYLSYHLKSLLSLSPAAL